MSRRVAMLSATLLLLLAPASGRAAFHLSVIDEIMSGAGGDPSVQYVEIRMLAPFQSFITGARLVAFNCDGTQNTILLQAPSDLKNQGTDVRWIMATSGFAAAACITPDFTIPAGIPAACGMICWGGGPLGPTRVLPENPPTWNPADLSNYVDCVAYGGYTGPVPTALSGTPTSLPPGDGTRSLTRSTNTHDNSADFALAAPTPTNDAGQVGAFTGAPCPTTTTTSTTTTTTIPIALAGKTLVLTDDPNPAKKVLVVLTKDPAINLGAGPGSADDPMLHGATLRVLTAGGCAGPCDDTYALPASGWSRLGTPGKVKGYKYADKLLANGPIKTALVKAGKLEKLLGKGAKLGHALAANPAPVDVVFSLGARQSCLAFGGTQKFTAGKKFSAKDAPAGSCPP